MPSIIDSRVTNGQKKEIVVHKKDGEHTEIHTSSYGETPSENDMTAEEGERLMQFIDGTVNLPAWRVFLLAFSLLMGLVLSIMDLSIVPTATYTIATDLNGGLGTTTWIILAYTLVYLGFAVIVARVSDVFGRRWSVTASFVTFIAASCGAAASKSLNSLIAFRAVQGLGATGLYSLSMVVLPEISPIKLLPLISSLIGMTIALAAVLGPVLGGTIAQYSTWRWIFWLNVPSAGLAVLAFLIACPQKVRGFELSEQKMRHLDWLGFLLMLTFSTLFIFGLQEAGIGAFEWNSPVMISTLVIGLLSGILLIPHQFYMAKKHPEVALIMPTRIITDRVMLAGILSTLFTGFSHTLVLFYLPLRFQVVNLSSPKDAGIHILPFLGATAIGAAIGGAASSKKNNTFVTFLVAAILVIVGCGTLTLLSDNIAVESANYGYQVILGLGTSMTMASVTIMTNLQCDPRDHAVSQGLISQVRVLGGSIGVAAFNIDFSEQLLKLQDMIPLEILKHLQSETRLVDDLTLVQKNQIRITFAKAFGESMKICIGAAALALIASLFTWQQNAPTIDDKKAEVEKLIITQARAKMGKADKEARGLV